VSELLTRLSEGLRGTSLGGTADNDDSELSEVILGFGGRMGAGLDIAVFSG